MRSFATILALFGIAVVLTLGLLAFVNSFSRNQLDKRSAKILAGIIFVLSLLGAFAFLGWAGAGRIDAGIFQVIGWISIVVTLVLLWTAFRGDVLPQVAFIGGTSLLIGLLILAYSHHDLPYDIHQSGWIALTIGVVVASGFLYLSAWRLRSREIAVAPMPERADLQIEKRILLKAIKEVEFDRALGKLSDEEAEKMTSDYKSRAVLVLKALDHQNDGEKRNEDWVDSMIDKELKARMAIAGLVSGAVRKAKKQKEAQSS